MQNLVGIDAVVRYYASFFNIVLLTLGNAYSRPKIASFGGFDPLNRQQSHRDPQKALPCAEARYIV